LFDDLPAVISRQAAAPRRILGRDDIVFAAPLQGFAQRLLALGIAVANGRVEIVDAEVHGAVKYLDCGILIDMAVDHLEAHRPEPEGRYLESGSSQ
jgi:hypothetical protein